MLAIHLDRKQRPRFRDNERQLLRVRGLVLDFCFLTAGPPSRYAFLFFFGLTFKQSCLVHEVRIYMCFWVINFRVINSYSVLDSIESN